MLTHNQRLSQMLSNSVRMRERLPVPHDISAAEFHHGIAPALCRFLGNIAVAVREVQRLYPGHYVLKGRFNRHRVD